MLNNEEMKNLSRNQFIMKLSGVGAFFSMKSYYSSNLQDRPAPLDAKVVQEFVRLGHFDLDSVTNRLNETPALLNAATDWGAGDFETALGAASHMGRRDIAEFLISKGARIDIFTLAMLGRLDLVQAMCESYPQLLNSTGPHGITLLMHAQKGGENAISVVNYLKQKGVNK
jgi:hypothetical protein